MHSSSAVLDRMLDPLRRTLNPDAARSILSLRADAEMQQRMDYLADRCNEGLATAEELAEYDEAISAASLIAVLQSKARAALATSPAA